MAEKEWEKKKQSMFHYDGWEFEKMLQEAEANILKGIPNTEVAVEGGIMPSPIAAPSPATEQQVKKCKPSAPPRQGTNLLKLLILLSIIPGSTIYIQH